MCSQCAVWTRQASGGSLAPEIALGEGGEDADLDKQANRRLGYPQETYEVARTQGVDEAATVERCEAERQRVVPLERRCLRARRARREQAGGHQQLEPSEGGDQQK